MDVFDLAAKISLDSSEYEKGLNEAESKGSGLASKLGSGFATAAKVTGAAVAAGAGAVATLTSQAVDAYANYEQLQGGVQKLYGNMGQSLEEYAQANGKTVDAVRDEWQKLEDAQNLVLDNAKNAYKTAGMSANEYMETATSFSAALINSLEGDSVKAAEYTDTAMRAISDNYNTFGGDIENVKNAFMGFAKQNYSMLDNLKLGYGGTKTEMEKLIADANEYGASVGKASDLSIENFADVVEAIQLIQEKQNIAGTTEREALSTIEGSMNALKASWTNLLTGFADGEADLDQLFDTLVESALAVMDNLEPVIEKALTSLGQVITRLVPYMTEMFPELVNQLLPPLLNAASQLVSGLLNALPTIIGALAGVAPEVIKTIVSALIDNLPAIIDSGVEILLALVDGIIESLPELINAMPKIIDAIVNTLTNNAPKLAVAAVKLIIALAGGLIKAIPQLVRAIPQIIRALVNGLGAGIKEMASAGGNLVSGIWSGFVGKLSWIKQKITGWVGNVVSFIKGLFKIGSPSKLLADEVGQFLPQGIAVGIEANAESVYDQMDEMRQKVSKPFDVSVEGETNLKTIEAPREANNRDTRELIEILGSYLPMILDKIGNDIYMDGRKVAEVVDEYFGDMSVQRARAN